MFLALVLLTCVLYVCVSSSAETSGGGPQRPGHYQPDAAVPAGAAGAAVGAAEEGVHLRSLLRRLHQAHLHLRRHQLPHTTQVPDDADCPTIHFDTAITGS